MNYLLLSTFGEIAEYVLYILIAVLVLLVMITVHEFGHYISGKIFGFGIDEFSIGFGPKLFSKKRKSGEVFSLRLIPLGGYCAFTGEDEESDNPKAFNNKKAWQRIIVLVSGALMNFLLAIVIICTMFGIYGHTAIMTYKVKTDVEYSQEYSFSSGDVILGINGKNVYLITDVMNVVDGKSKGEEISCKVIRNGKIQNITVKLRSDINVKNVEDLKNVCDAFGLDYTVNAEGEIADSGFRSTGVKYGFFKTVGKSFGYAFKFAGTVFTVLGQLITGSLGIGSLGGTVTTISVTASAIKTGGLWSLLNISGFIGVNLAVFNLLPIPALDGSRVVFTFIEWIRKKPINRKTEGIIHTVGFILILVFAVFIDLQQCF